MTINRHSGRGRAACLLVALVSLTGALAGFVAASTPAPSAAASRVAGAPAPVYRSHPMVPVAGAHIAGHGFGAVSSNWSGYVEQGGPFTSVSAQWVVPAVIASSSPQSSGTWIGIDGVSNTTLIQTGTAQETVSGQTNYYAWWETLPAAATELWPVVPGDTMQASVAVTTPNHWTITIQDVTSHQSFTNDVIYSTPGTSAEWIEEAPSDGQSILTLANYGTVRFSGLASNNAAPPAASLQAVDMIDSSQAVISHPGAYDSGANAFSVAYTGPVASTTTTTTTTPTTTTTVPGGPPPAACSQPADQAVAGHPVAIAAMRTSAGCEGYWVVTAEGQVVAFGAAHAYGDLSAVAHAPIVAIIGSATGLGYWLATADGLVRGYGDAVAVGDMGGHHLNGSIIAMAATPDGKGYWLVGSDGGIFSFGDAAFFGSTGNLHLNKPVVGIAPAPGGTGYWLVASDGGVFTFGTATFLGSMGATRLNKPVVGMTADPGGRGYRMVASDGGIFSFGAPFFGSLGSTPPAAGVQTMAPSPDGNGYYMLGGDGAVYAFGDAAYLGRA
ncbi:MAG TPA: G1 family glutamic endopeptidase [Acidimicrobiales bacterium]|nr:G1 family glutamic endopeptidase [Acidimicrobiales bacterium]